MPYQKLQFRPGIVRDTTALANEGGWYEGNNIRFRMGLPEKIGGWINYISDVFLGTCRTLSAWRTLGNATLIGVGTSLKMYIAYGGAYRDITPLRASQSIAANAFTTASGSSLVTLHAPAHGAVDGDYFILSGAASSVGGLTAANLTGEFVVSNTIDANTFTFSVALHASSTATGGNVYVAFQLSPTPAHSTVSGWGAGAWSTYGWGQGLQLYSDSIWSQVTFGQLLIFGQTGGAPYVYDPTSATTPVFNRGVLVSSLPGASGVPTSQNLMFFSPAAHILVFCGTNSTAGGSTYDPLLVRWADSDSIVQWTPAITNQAGEYRLPQGSKIVAAANARQDTLLLTDTAAYLMQYVGAPYIFSFSRQSDNISIINSRAIVSAGGNVFWMGYDKFYYYDGTVRTLPCPLRNEVFGNLNPSADSTEYIFAGTNEGFNEIWWFYSASGNSDPDRYVIFNYVDTIWYYGSMQRTAWLDTPLAAGPLAGTQLSNLVTHEVGIDDLSGGIAQPINAYIKSADFDIGDGQNYAFVRKFLPDVNFAGSTAASPRVALTVQGRKNPGGTVVATPAQTVTLTATNPNIRFTDELSIRLRARQMNVTIQSTDIIK